MKFACATAGILLIIVAMAFDAQSDELPDRQTQMRRQYVSQLGRALVETLSSNYEERLTEFRGGRSKPGRLVEINRELYDAQLRDAELNVADRRMRGQIAENFVSRAKTIESITKSNLDNGTGTSMDLLDAKGSRLQAEIELATISYK